MPSSINSSTSLKLLNHLQRALRKVPFPRFCLLCQSLVKSGSLCEFCESSLPWLVQSCIHCGVAIEHQSNFPGTCGSCINNPPAFTLCKAVFNYTSPISELISQFKFNARFEAGRLLATLLANAILDFYAGSRSPQVLLPVPLHCNRLRNRGFNQTVEIAKVISRRTGIPQLESGIKKIRDTNPQHALNARQRGKNLTAAFVAGNELIAGSYSHVAIIDDVVTTMTTVETISKLLKETGIQRVDVWAIARAAKHLPAI